MKPGPTNDKFFVIEEGLAEGERIAVYPRGYLDRVSLPALAPQQREKNEATASKPGAPPNGVGKDGGDAAKEKKTAAASEPETAAPAAG